MTVKWRKSIDNDRYQCLNLIIVRTNIVTTGALCNKIVAFFDKNVAFYNKGPDAFCNKLLLHFVIK